LTIPATLLVHGGAGPIPDATANPRFGGLARDGLAAAIEAGRRVLAGGGDALTAVAAAVECLEDCPAFNAGRGAVRNAEGDVELDAALMEGSRARVGAVSGLRGIAHPIAAARALLDDGRHVMLAGAGAEAFARRAGIETIDPQLLIDAAPGERASAADAESAARWPGDTVGAVALDASGALAAATSTGGTIHKLPGRVSDSALVGSGTWACDATCAISATGQGEYFIRTAFAHGVHALIQHGRRDLEGACRHMLSEVEALGGHGGCIALDRLGHVALPFNTAGMPRGLLRVGEPARIAVHPEETLRV